ncbi:MAG: hypothetical protein WBZ20_10335 [Nitrososphaeraceae archaeon]
MFSYTFSGNLCFNNPGITIIFIFGLWFVNHIELIYLAKIPMNEVTSEAATKHDAAITTNFMLLIDYCGYYYSVIRAFPSLLEDQS